MISYALRQAAAQATPPPPPAVSFGGTITGAMKAYTTGGVKGVQAFATKTAKSVAQQVVGSIPIVGSIPFVGDFVGDLIGGLVGTKSKANWDRTLGRIYRAALLGYVPPVQGAEGIIGQLKRAWQDVGDSTGAQFWDRVVAYFNVPTEAGGTKEGFNAGAPAGSKQAEAMAGFAPGLLDFLRKVG